MEVGAHNQLKARVTGIKRGEVMAQIKLDIPAKSAVGSVITVESPDELGLEAGDEVELFVKAFNVLPLNMVQCGCSGRGLWLLGPLPSVVDDKERVDSRIGDAHYCIGVYE